MKIPFVVTGISLVMWGCSARLPEIPPNHPANAEAPGGQLYRTPAVLEVRPFIRPPAKPSSQPAGPVQHGSRDMEGMDMEHGGMHMNHLQGTRPTHESMPHPSPDEARQPNQHLQHEGQHHD